MAGFRGLAHTTAHAAVAAAAAAAARAAPGSELFVLLDDVGVDEDDDANGVDGDDDDDGGDCQSVVSLLVLDDGGGGSDAVVDDGRRTPTYSSYEEVVAAMAARASSTTTSNNNNDGNSNDADGTESDGSSAYLDAHDHSCAPAFNGSLSAALASRSSIRKGSASIFSFTIGGGGSSSDDHIDDATSTDATDAAVAVANSVVAVSATTTHGGSIAALATAASIDACEAVYHPHHVHHVRHIRPRQSLLPLPLASIVSSLSMASRAGIRLTAAITSAVSETVKFSASASLGITRRALVSAVSSARSLHLRAMRLQHQQTPDQPFTPDDPTPFFNVLDRYTNMSIYAIHNVFSLAELFTITSFHLTTTTINFSLRAAEECVVIFDGLFGETETSKALAAFICIFLEEWQGHDDALGLGTTRFANIVALGQISKAMTAYCCLQYVTRKRRRSLVKLTPVFVGRAVRVRGAYDPTQESLSLDMFNMGGGGVGCSGAKAFVGLATENVSSGSNNIANNTSETSECVATSNPISINGGADTDTSNSGNNGRIVFEPEAKNKSATWSKDTGRQRHTRPSMRRRSFDVFSSLRYPVMPLQALSINVPTPQDLMTKTHPVDALTIPTSPSAFSSTSELFHLSRPSRRRCLSGTPTDVTRISDVIQMIEAMDHVRRTPASPIRIPTITTTTANNGISTCLTGLDVKSDVGNDVGVGVGRARAHTEGDGRAITASVVPGDVHGGSGSSVHGNGGGGGGGGSLVTACGMEAKYPTPPPQPVSVSPTLARVANKVEMPAKQQHQPQHKPVTSCGRTMAALDMTMPPDFSPWTSSPTAHVEMASRFIKFAIGAYGTNFLKIMGLGRAWDHALETDGDHHNHQSLALHANIPVDHIVTSSFLDPDVLEPPTVIAPVHYVVVDRSTRSVVVCLRGTLGLSDVVTDLTASYVSYQSKTPGLSGYVHSGIFKSALKIAQSPVCDAVAETLRRHPGYALVLTGHSLGGGCAAMVSMLWSRCVQPNNGNGSGGGDPVFITDAITTPLPARPIHCYVYGSPAIMSAGLSRYHKSLISCFVFRDDVVPCLSLGLIRDFRNVTINLCHETGVAEKVIGKVLGIFKEFPNAGGGSSSTSPSSSSSKSSSASAAGLPSGNNASATHGTARRVTHTGADMGASAFSDESPDSLWFWALLKTLRADMRADKLYPPGTVYWINAETASSTATTTPSHVQPRSRVSVATPVSVAGERDSSSQRVKQGVSPIVTGPRTPAVSPGPPSSPATVTGACGSNHAETPSPSIDHATPSSPLPSTIPISVHEVDDVEVAFGEMAFSTRMFTDHSPHHYEGSLELLSRAMRASVVNTDTASCQHQKYQKYQQHGYSQWNYHRDVCDGLWHGDIAVAAEPVSMPVP